MYLAFLPFGSVLVFLFTFIIILLCAYIVKCFYKKDCRKWSKKLPHREDTPTLSHTVSRGQRGSLRGCCKRPSCPALRSAVRWVKRSARTMASPNGNGKTLFFCFRRRSLRNGADCDCQGGKGGDFRKEILPVPWLAQSGTGGISSKKKNKQGFPIQQEAVYLPRRATLRRWVRIYRGRQEKAVRNAYKPFVSGAWIWDGFIHTCRRLISYHIYWQTMYNVIQ